MSKIQGCFEEYTNATLPMSESLDFILDPIKAKDFGDKLSGKYTSAVPFPHIVIDNFLPQQIVDNLLTSFPVAHHASDKLYESGYSGLHKRQIFPESCPVNIRNFFHFMNSAPILRFLQGLTKIESLIGDPYFEGGGLHETYSGGKLGIHSDFRINENLNLNRRINIIIYLNKDWDSSFGGGLELWDNNMQNKVDCILPVFNRCVIFNTDESSYHGHPDPLTTPDDISRKSIALYYYTASKKIYEETPAFSTMYYARPEESNILKREALKLRLGNYFKDWLPPVIFRILTKIRNN